MKARVMSQGSSGWQSGSEEAGPFAQQPRARVKQAARFSKYDDSVYRRPGS
jgi:hypothetical protein